MLIIHRISIFIIASLVIAAPLLPASAQTTYKREEQSLLDLSPVAGDWIRHNREIAINGQVFSRAAQFRMRRNETEDTASISNRGDYDLLEAYIGIRDDIDFSGRCRFVVKGDSTVLYISDYISKGDQPQKISVSIKGYSGVTIGIQDWQLSSRYTNTAIFADPKLVRLIPQESAPPPAFNPSGNNSGSQRTIQVMLNGQQLGFTGTAPVRIGGRVMVPMRDIFESLGAQVRWVPSNQTINAQRGNTMVQMQIGNYAATVNGRRINLDQPPVLYRASTMVPLRFVAEAMNAQVNWNEYANVVTISSGG